MFWHNFKYSLKTLLKSKMLLFWTFAFPIILGTLFNMAFSNIENNEKLEIINIAIVDNEDFKNNEMFKEAFETLSSENSTSQMFNTTYTSLEKSKEMLENEEITGYLLFNGEDVTIKVNSSGINETILRNVVDQIQSKKEMIGTLAKKEIEDKYKQGNFNIDYNGIYANVMAKIDKNDVKLNNISNKNLSYTMIEYYTLIAMAALYGGIISMFTTNFKLGQYECSWKKNFCITCS